MPPGFLLVKYFCLLLLLTGCAANAAPEKKTSEPKVSSDTTEENVEIATLAGGCFWCIEAVYNRIDGVKSTLSGYMGGHLDDPTYDDILTGNSGHAEVVQISFDLNVLSYEELLEVFWHAHDPTTLNRQGADVGTQYRAAIFYHSAEQKEIAEASRTKAAKLFVDPIVTEVTEASIFYPAEDYHQEYFENNSTAPYCQAVITPKLRKLNLKEESLNE